MWIKNETFAVGGLREIGFRKNTDFLLVLSADGRGLFDCLAGQKKARNSDDYYSDYWNSETGLIDGFDIFKNEKIHCGGFEHPNTLSKTTVDGWAIIVENETRLDYKQTLQPAQVMYLIDAELNEKIEVHVFFMI